MEVPEMPFNRLGSSHAPQVFEMHVQLSLLSSVAELRWSAGFIASLGALGQYLGVTATKVIQIMLWGQKGQGW